MITNPRILNVEFIQSPIFYQPSHDVPIAFLAGYIFYAQIEVEYHEKSKVTVMIDRQVIVRANVKSIRRGRRKIRKMVRRFECYLYMQHKPATDPDFVRKICGFPH